MSIAHAVMKYHKELEVVPCWQCQLSSEIYHPPQFLNFKIYTPHMVLCVVMVFLKEEEVVMC